MKNSILIFIVFIFIFNIFIICSTSTTNAQDQSKDKITNFVSKIYINTDKTIKIEEKIEIFTEGEVIKHGIERFLPVFLFNNNEKLSFSSIKIENVLLDGQKINFEKSYENSNLKIKIGEKDSLLQKGKHTFDITYYYSNIIQKTSYDIYEFYLPIIGKYLNLQIDNLTVFVNFPEKADDFNFMILYYNVIFDYNDNIRPDYEVIVDEKGDSLIFKLNEPLYENQPFSIELKWSGNIFNEIKTSDSVFNNIEFNINSLIKNIPLYFFNVKGISNALYNFIISDYTLYQKVKQTLIILVISILLIIMTKIYLLFKKSSGYNKIIEQRISCGLSYFLVDNLNLYLYTFELIALILKKAISLIKEKDQYIIIKNENKENLSLDEQSVLSSIFKNSETVPLSSVKKDNFLTCDDFFKNIQKTNQLFRLIFNIILLALIIFTFYIGSYQDLYKLYFHIFTICIISIPFIYSSIIKKIKFNNFQKGKNRFKLFLLFTTFLALIYTFFTLIIKSIEESYLLETLIIIAQIFMLNLIIIIMRYFSSKILIKEYVKKRRILLKFIKFLKPKNNITNKLDRLENKYSNTFDIEILDLYLFIFGLDNVWAKNGVQNRLIMIEDTKYTIKDLFNLIYRTLYSNFYPQNYQGNYRYTTISPYIVRYPHRFSNLSSNKIIKPNSINKNTGNPKGGIKGW